MNHFIDMYQVRVKSLSGWEVHIVLAHSKMPLSNNTGVVANSLQTFSNGGLIERQSCIKVMGT